MTQPLPPTTTSALARLMARAAGPASSGAPAETVATGFPSLDRVLGGGLRRGDLCVLTGDAASGKSALALMIALRGAAGGHVTQLVTGEMTPARVLERALAMEGRVALDEMRRGAIGEAANGALGAAAFQLRGHAPEIELLPPGGVAPLADVLRRALDLELAVVDSLPGLATGARPREEELATTVRELKALALELNIALLLTAPLAVPLRGRADPRPQLDDLGALGALKTEADVVLALFREEMYEADRGIEGATELHVLKNRHGATAYVDLYFYKRWLRFEDMVE